MQTMGDFPSSSYCEVPPHFPTCLRCGLCWSSAGAEEAQERRRKPAAPHIGWTGAEPHRMQLRGSLEPCKRPHTINKSAWKSIRGLRRVRVHKKPTLWRGAHLWRHGNIPSPCLRCEATSLAVCASRLTRLEP